MCILFLHVSTDEDDSDYKLILASNRDEFYDRPAQNMAPWSEDPTVIGGRDLEAGCDGGTWMALSPLRKKIGVLLNLPQSTKKNTKSRGKIVADFVKSESSTNEYVNSIKSYVRECNEFVLVTVEMGPAIHSYSNATDQLYAWTEPTLGFGNSLPDTPLKKVEVGKSKLKDICGRFNKISLKTQLVEELIQLLRTTERHLPDPELERRRPNLYEQLSSIFVCIPEGRYGTRTHTIILVTRKGRVDVIEVSLQAPIDPSSPNWQKTEFQFDM